MHVLEDLWQSRITPCERAVLAGSPYEKISSASTEQYEKIRKELPSEGRKALEDYYNLELELAEISSQDAFVRGVRFGAGFILDVIGEYHSQLPQIQDECQAG